MPFVREAIEGLPVVASLHVAVAGCFVVTACCAVLNQAVVTFFAFVVATRLFTFIIIPVVAIIFSVAEILFVGGILVILTAALFFDPLFAETLIGHAPARVARFLPALVVIRPLGASR